MERRTYATLLFTRWTLLAVVFAILAADADAQLRGRRFLRRDLKEMEEYYDDLEDFYEDRDPRLAREAERMEHYYEDLRKGRAVGPAPVFLPRLRVLIDPRIPNVDRGAPAAEPPLDPQTQPRSRWQPWGAAAPTEQPPPTPTPGRVEVRRAPREGFGQPGELQFPSAMASISASTLEQFHARFVAELEQLARRNPTAATRWREYLALPASESPEMTADEYYTTASGREQLAKLMERFDQVAADPQFRMISRLAGFNATRGELRNLLASLDEQPTLAEPEQPATEAEELPAPPAD